MYYICKFFPKFIVFNDENKTIANYGSGSVEQAISRYKEDNFGVTRDIRVENGYLLTGHSTYRVVMVLEDLDSFNKKNYPEWFI